MPPSPQSVHVDALLTDFSRKYRNNDYVADVLMPVKPVTKLSDEFLRYSKTSSFTIPDTTHGVKSKAKQVSWAVDTDSYSLKPKALMDYVSDYEKANADPAVDLEMDTTEYLTDQLLLAKESAAATLLTTTSTYGSNFTTLAGNDQWDSGDAAATPIADINTGIQACVLRPNVMVVGQEVWDTLKEDATLCDKIKYSQLGIVTEDLVAAVFGLDKVVVAGAMGYVSGTLTYLWGKHVILAHVEPPKLRSVQFGLTFASQQAHQVRRWAEPSIGGGSVAIEVNWAYDLKIVAADVAYLIDSAVS